jgi:SPX domain protein involved in polyphosphate accumulation
VADNKEQLKEELDNVTADITKLAKFNSLNYTAFLKVLKKHDKLTNIRLKNTFLTRLTKQPFYKETFDAMIVRLSALYEKLKPKDRPELSGNVCGVLALQCSSCILDAALLAGLVNPDLIAG